ncbi:hypothetical protein PF005_g5214 [Phytophthora fragariae]|uniref:Aminoacyl-tRNA synthetase class II (D/K/N) domain-containing protein n=1 Tax=Phytophthora fragariae TaxID=53985 RepID=A0A6A3T4T6_9STRA|nr:hypothetical protein PF009_g5627 [Phytophthora fragariae]KAE9129255.1 hypothetical protein PF007_g4972 [Phytophthora fragariae]KAE9226223.1 hypothetical protein PF005_g5214 [Phytophthora fragariae]
MSFVTREDIMGQTERLVKEIWMAVYKGLLDRPFVRIAFDDAMHSFGVDKPDMRYGIELEDVTTLSKSLNSCRSGLHGQSRSLRSPDMDELEKVAKLASKMVGAFVVKVKGIKQWKSSLANTLFSAAIDQRNERLGAEEVMSSSSRPAPISK